MRRLLPVLFVGVLTLFAPSARLVVHAEDPPPVMGGVSDQVGEVKVSPQTNDTLLWSPRQFVLEFPDPPVDVEVSLADGEGLNYPAAVPSVVVGNQLVFHPPQIFEGVYTVSWDGPYAGSYQFTIRGATQIETVGPTAAPPAPSPVSAATSDEKRGTPGAPSALVYLTVGLLAALLVIVAFRRRAPILLVGSLVVLAAGVPAAAFLRTAPDLGDRSSCLAFQGERRIDCLADVAIVAYEAAGIPGAIDELHGLAEDPRFLAGTGENVCHSVAHVLAREVVAREGSIAEVAAAGDTTCGSGFLHGAVEGGSVLVSSDVFAREVQDICGDDDSELASQCAHGIGHGAAMRFNARVEESADVCFGLPNESQAVQCLLGATMVTGEWFANMGARTAVLADMAPPGMAAGHIGEVCLGERFRASGDRFKACLEGMFGFLKAGPDVMDRMASPWSSIETMGDWCVGVSSEYPSLSSACFASLGTASAMRKWVEPSQIPQVCFKALEEAAGEACTAAVIMQVRNNQRQSPPPEVFAAVCAAAPPSTQEFCRYHAERLAERSLD